MEKYAQVVSSIKEISEGCRFEYNEIMKNVRNTKREN